MQVTVLFDGAVDKLAVVPVPDVVLFDLDCILAFAFIFNSFSLLVKVFFLGGFHAKTKRSIKAVR